MSLLSLIDSFLFSISAALHHPVMLGLALLVFCMLFLLGALLREWRERRRGLRPGLQAWRTRLAALLASTPPRLLELEIERALQDSERQLAARLERVRFIVRAGPGLGLMGTLIPMGEALAALATGSMPQMAQLMVNAFNSAVVGLGAGVLAFAVTLVREHWLRADVLEMRYLTELAQLQPENLARSGDGAAAPAAAAGEALA